MNRTSNTLWLLSGLAIAAAALPASAAGNQQPGQSMGTQQRKAAVDNIKKNHKQFSATQPRTMAQADATKVRLPSGASAMRAPTELWNHLSVQRDAQGKLHQVETSNGETPAATIEAAQK